MVGDGVGDGLDEPLHVELDELEGEEIDPGIHQQSDVVNNIQLLGGSDNVLGFVYGSALPIQEIQTKANEVDAGHQEHDDRGEWDESVIECEVLEVEQH